MIFWMLLTFSSLPFEEQVKYIDKIPRAHEVLSYASRNPLRHLVASLIEYYSGWFDEISPGLDSQNFIDFISEKENLETYTYEEFENGVYWQVFRVKAKNALIESNMGCFPLTGIINFYDLIEITNS
ncbi:MAG: hypothetical protein RL095_1774 [Verrucomicrobiota bacterium]